MKYLTHHDLLWNKETELTYVSWSLANNLLYSSAKKCSGHKVKHAIQEYVYYIFNYFNICIFNS